MAAIVREITFLEKRSFILASHQSPLTPNPNLINKFTGVFERQALLQLGLERSNVLPFWTACHKEPWGSLLNLWSANVCSLLLVRRVYLGRRFRAIAGQSAIIWSAFSRSTYQNLQLGVTWTPILCNWWLQWVWSVVASQSMRRFRLFWGGQSQRSFFIYFPCFLFPERLLLFEFNFDKTAALSRSDEYWKSTKSGQPVWRFVLALPALREEQWSQERIVKGEEIIPNWWPVQFRYPW